MGDYGLEAYVADNSIQYFPSNTYPASISESMVIILPQVSFPLVLRPSKLWEEHQTANVAAMLIDHESIY